MAVKLSVDTVDQVPAELKTLYVERDGKFVLDVEGLPDVGALQRAIEQERRQRAQATTAKGELERRVHELEEELRTAKLTPSDAVKEAETLKRGYDERLKAVEMRLAQEAEQRQAAEGKLAETRISDVLRQAALEAGVAKESVEDLISLPKFRATWRVTPEGEPAPFEGEMPRFEPDAPGRPMSAKTYVRQYLQEHRHWVAPPAGGGAPGSGPLRQAAGVISVNKADLRNPAVYARLKEEAAKTGAQIEIIDSK